ncbi:hypothetical protein [Serinibacter arcticus]|uniref:hypothetical protein n=1 Tax=Serinibacter arcticus TaxID=1655435 RepID=UPI001C128CDF|nr:hypothetical protein [Serinibacter arcticus]
MTGVADGGRRRPRLRAALLLGVVLLGATGVSACNESRAPMLQPVAPVPDVTDEG